MDKTDHVGKAEAHLTVKAFPSLNAPPGAHMHTVFLERASQPGNDQRAHALGSFLTLRAIDRMAGHLRPALVDGIAHQLRAAASYLEELHPQSKDVSHLREIVRVAQRSLRTNNRGLLWPPLLAFAYWLENELRLDESLDVLETAFRLKDGTEIREQIAGYLQQGRVLRVAGRFPESREAYLTGGNLARYTGDLRSEMVSRIGRAWVMLKTGDLPAGERELHAVLADAQSNGDVFVEARACHDLAVAASYARRTAEAIPLVFRAYELYDEPLQRARALSDMGMFLKELGHYSAASEALTVALESNNSPVFRVNTVLELLELAALVQDRVGFERCRKELEGQRASLPPAEHVDFEMKLGSGLAAFGQRKDALVRLEEAVSLAEKYQLGQRVFEAEGLIAELNKGATHEKATNASPSVASREELDAPEVLSAIEELYAIRAGAG